MSKSQEVAKLEAELENARESITKWVVKWNNQNHELQQAQGELEQSRQELIDNELGIDVGGRRMTVIENLWMTCKAELQQAKEEITRLGATIDSQEVWREKLKTERDALKAESDMLKLMLDADGDLFIELTMKIDEHPEGYERACLCRLCQSYGD